MVMVGAEVITDAAVGLVSASEHDGCRAGRDSLERPPLGHRAIPFGKVLKT